MLENAEEVKEGDLGEASQQQQEMSEQLGQLSSDMNQMQMNMQGAQMQLNIAAKEAKTLTCPTFWILSGINRAPSIKPA